MTSYSNAGVIEPVTPAPPEVTVKVSVETVALDKLISSLKSLSNFFPKPSENIAGSSVSSVIS